MSDYIKREDAIHIASKSPFFSNALMEEIKAIPSADVIPRDYYDKVCEALCEKHQKEVLALERKSGEWILSESQNEADNSNGNYQFECSNCGRSDIHAKTQEVPYCWWCGAMMMRGEKDE